MRSDNSGNIQRNNVWYIALSSSTECLTVDTPVFLLILQVILQCQLENVKVKEKNRLNRAGINQDATGSTIVGNPNYCLDRVLGPNLSTLVSRPCCTPDMLGLCNISCFSKSTAMVPENICAAPQCRFCLFKTAS